jgi:hypothetical protein
MDRAELIAAAEQVLAEAPGLLPAGTAPEVSAQLADLVSRARSGEPVEDELILVVTGQDRLRERFDELLPADDVAKEGGGYEELPGYGEPVDVTYFACPQGDYCYPVLEVGEAVPLCPVHRVPLVAE